MTIDLWDSLHFMLILKKIYKLGGAGQGRARFAMAVVLEAAERARLVCGEEVGVGSRSVSRVLGPVLLVLDAEVDVIDVDVSVELVAVIAARLACELYWLGGKAGLGTRFLDVVVFPRHAKLRRVVEKRLRVVRVTDVASAGELLEVVVLESFEEIVGRVAA